MLEQSRADWNNGHKNRKRCNIITRDHSVSTSKQGAFEPRKCSTIIRHGLMEMDRISMAVLTIFVGPFSAMPSSHK
jgi:hypothetical protein